MAGIQIPDDVFSQAIAQQILTNLTPEVRDKILTDAIASLNAPTSVYGSPKTALQQAFERAVEVAMNTAVREVVETSPEISGRIRQVAEDFVRLFPEDFQDEEIQRVMLGALVKHVRERGLREF